MTALTNARPLTPIPKSRLLKPNVTADERDLNALAFLTYEEKLLAGSWRFLTYFGRDTLLSIRLLMPALRPEVIEAGLGAVIARLHEDGSVAHEEDIGDFAALRRLARGESGDALARPIYDYKMVDDDFLLAPVLAHYLLDTPEGQHRAATFLSRQAGDRTYAAAIRDNLRHVMKAAAPFANQPRAENLVRLKDGENVGEWRDSLLGLAGGRVPYNVNVALVPAALKATARLLESPLFASDPKELKAVQRAAKIWADEAWKPFRVELSRKAARRATRIYGKELGVPFEAAARSITGPLTFPALSLDSNLKPVPVMHSDDGFMLLFTEPTAARVEEACDRVLRPFPAGLSTPVGLIVANAAFAREKATRETFGPGAYHGAVIWSWQQALLASGLEHQLKRDDLPLETLSKLKQAKDLIWRLIQNTATQRTTELWSWKLEGGRYVVAPFGSAQGHETESNAVQLWSTVYLGLRAPSSD